MKYATKGLIALLAAISLPALVMAEGKDVAVETGSPWGPGLPSKTVKSTPTGYEIRGCTFFEMKDGQVRHICDERHPEVLFKRQDSGGDK